MFQIRITALVAMLACSISPQANAAGCGKCPGSAFGEAYCFTSQVIPHLTMPLAAAFGLDTNTTRLWISRGVRSIPVITTIVIDGRTDVLIPQTAAVLLGGASVEHFYDWPVSVVHWGTWAATLSLLQVSKSMNVAITTNALKEITKFQKNALSASLIVDAFKVAIAQYYSSYINH